MYFTQIFTKSIFSSKLYSDDKMQRVNIINFGISKGLAANIIANRRIISLHHNVTRRIQNSNKYKDTLGLLASLLIRHLPIEQASFTL